MKQTESEKLEFKSSFAEWREAVISLCAFANKKGGKVIIGMKDDGTINEIQVGKNTIEDFANKIKNNTDPILYPSINVETFGLGEIVEIEVSESDNKPVFAFERAYMRVGKTNQKMSQTEVRELIKRYTLPDFDEQPIDAKIAKQVKFDQSLWARFKKKAPNLAKKGEEISYGVYLCFVERNIEFHNAIIKAARFKGLKAVEFIDEKEFDGPLLLMPEEIMAFIQRHINKQIVISGKAQHDEIWDYPLDALREAIMNAIVHRDYNDSGNVQIRIFDDRIEIWSPGILPKEVDISEIYKRARSVLRNKLIMRIFHKYGLIENWGTGFQRMLELCRKNGNPDPVFSYASGAFVVSFKKIRQAEGVTEGVTEGVAEGVKKLKNYISNNPGKRTSQMVKAGIAPQKTIERWIKKLKEDGLVEFVGSPKSGGYFIRK